MIANSKPSKAIEFDTGMGLVNLADEYERLCARDFEAELADPDLSRRKRVQIEDAKVALELSVVEEATASVATSVSFRHLALWPKSSRKMRACGRVCERRAPSLTRPRH